MAKQKHDIGQQKRRRYGNIKETADYGALARSLVERGLCTAYILEGRA
jgi:hypothetical protein